MLSTDVGSLPMRVDSFKDSKIFEREVLTSFIDKLLIGLNLPTYPQFRDMNEMFFGMMNGVEKTKYGYVLQDDISVKSNVIPEVQIIKQNVPKLKEMIDNVPMRVCITGPYTLFSLFKTRNNSLLENLGEVLVKIVEGSVFKQNDCQVKMMCIDEPTLGFMNDAFLDFGSSGREVLLHVWESVCKVAVDRGAETSIHIHNTSENLFWNVKHLNVIESHANDSFYSSLGTKRRLEETDKFLKASISVTIFDDLIRTEELDTDKIGEIWTGIRKGLINPTHFLESEDVMMKRLNNVVNFFGQERVKYVGPECGFKSYPTYECAMESLRRIISVKDKFIHEHDHK